MGVMKITKRDHSVDIAGTGIAVNDKPCQDSHSKYFDFHPDLIGSVAAMCHDNCV